MRRRPALIFYAIAFLMMAAAVLALLRLLRAFEGDLREDLAGIQRVFDEQVMKTPDDPGINFNQIRELATKYENHGAFGGITITKFFGSAERVVYPFYAPALIAAGKSSTLWKLRPQPGQLIKNERQLPLQLGQMKLGNLYVRLETAALQAVRVTVVLLSLLLAGTLLLFVTQFRRQEQVITATTVELEAKRRELVRIERLALAGQLSANVFHDLKKPVLNIKNELEEWREAMAANPAGAAAADRRMLEQVNLFFGILRESNLERFVRDEDEREYVDINEHIEKSLSLVRYERGAVHVESNLAEGLPPILAGPVRLIQVFSNLILNAFQAMRGNGTLSISTTRENSAIKVVISDTGPGISPGNLEKIFNPFFSTKSSETGTGLGLYITRDIIQDLGGTITPTSSSEGTTFTIRIPIS